MVCIHVYTHWYVYMYIPTYAYVSTSMDAHTLVDIYTPVRLHTRTYGEKSPRDTYIYGEESLREL